MLLPQKIMVSQLLLETQSFKQLNEQLLKCLLFRNYGKSNDHCSSSTEYVRLTFMVWNRRMTK